MIVDVVIILLLSLGAVLGFKKGAIKTLVSFVGLVLAFVIAYIFKTPLANFFYGVLPFVSFGGLFKGISAINILLYEMLAFFIILSILLVVVKILTFAAGTIEKVLKATIILGIPSKILGIFVGLIEGSIYAFVFVYIVSFPLFNTNLMEDSRIGYTYLKNYPILSNAVEKPVTAVTDIYKLATKYNKKNTSEFNKEAITVLLKHKITDQKTINKLVKKGKIEY